MPVVLGLCGGLGADQQNQLYHLFQDERKVQVTCFV
jgi:hypothetical protein